MGFWMLNNTHDAPLHKVRLVVHDVLINIFILSAENEMKSTRIKQTV